MPRDCKKILDITNHTTNWVAKIKVNEKSNARWSRNGAKRYQNLIFSDAEGKRVRATIFDNDIDFFEDTFTVLKSYYISNVSVRLARPEYKFGDTKFQWFINNQSHVEEVIEEEGEDIKGNTYNFVPLSDISNSNSEAEIDIIAVVLEILPPKIVKSETLTLQQLVLADSNLMKIVLSTWNNTMSTEIEALSEVLNAKPIIIVTRTKLSIYNGVVGLNTRASSTMIIDPQIAEATLLRTWCSNHEDDLNQLRKNKHHNSTASTSKTATVDIHEVLTSEKLDAVFLTKASILIHDLQQKFWYMGCSNCKKKTVAKHNDAISCSCPNKDATAQPWFRVVANLSDSTGTISATLFGNELKKLTSCTPIQMMNLFEEGRVDDIEDVVNKFNGQEHIFQLKAYQYGSAVNFTVLSIDDIHTDSQI